MAAPHASNAIGTTGAGPTSLTAGSPGPVNHAVSISPSLRDGSAYRFADGPEANTIPSSGDRADHRLLDLILLSLGEETAPSMSAGSSVLGPAPATNVMVLDQLLDVLADQSSDGSGDLPPHGAKARRTSITRVV